MITVVNKKTHIRTPMDFYVGPRSVLGNPYTHFKSRMTLPEYHCAHPTQAIAKYKPWLLTKLMDKTSPQYIEFHRLLKFASQHDIYLLCYCAPHPCHADFIKKLIENLLFPIDDPHHDPA